MEKYIGIGILILCMTPLVAVICTFGYRLFVSKEKIEVTQEDNFNQLKQHRD